MLTVRELNHTRLSYTKIAEDVVTLCGALNLVIPAGSRLDKMRRVVLERGENAVTLRDNPDFEIALESVRDLIQARVILSQMGRGAEFPRLFRRLVRDAVLPQENLKDSWGRDTQCELFVAAICSVAGLPPKLSEPDITLRFAGTSWGVAVKRIKNEKNFRKRIKEGIEQIAHTGLPGVIIADVSMMLNRENARIDAEVPDEVFRQAAQETQKRFLANYDSSFLEWTRGTKTRGIVFLDHHVRLHPEMGWVFTILGFQHNSSPHNQRRRNEFESFASKFSTGCSLLCQS